MHLPLTRRSLLAAFAATLAACGGKPPTVSNRPRVVSLSPSTTEAVFAVGGGYLLVGRSRFCDYPKEVESIAVVGGFADPNIEAILALAPTLVVGARGPAGPALAESLAARKIDTYFPETETLAQITEMITTLGRMLNHVTEARVTNQRIDILRKAVTAAVANVPMPRAVMLFDTAPIVVAGPGSFPDEMMQVARAQNLITSGGPYPTIGLEHLLALDPDVLIDGATPAMAGPSPLESKRDAPGWKSLRAFAQGAVRPIGSTVLRPGPRIGDGLRELARAVHGDAIKLK